MSHVNIGHSIQKLLHNTPIAVSANDTTTSVVTRGGLVFQSGLISNKIQNSFKEISVNKNLVGNVVDVQSTEDLLYLLNDEGVVFAYDYNTCDCPVIREVYSPSVCNGDPAVRIRSGKNHLVILTKHHKAWGVGSNDEYQLVPQGACHYDVAVELIVTDINIHDNLNACAFMGTFKESNKPLSEKHNDVSCVKDKLRCVKLGFLIIDGVNYQQGTDTPIIGTLYIPVYGDLSYVGFLCTGHGDVSGNVTYTVENVFIRVGCSTAKFIPNNCNIKDIKVKFSATKALYLEDACYTEVIQISSKSKKHRDNHGRDHGRDDGRDWRRRYEQSNCSSSESSDDDFSASSESEDDCCEKKPRKKKPCKPICKDIFKLKINTCFLNPLVVTNGECGLVITQPPVARDECDRDCTKRQLGCLPDNTTTIIALKCVKLVATNTVATSFKLSHEIKLDCQSECKVEEPKLAQPCWMSVYAGFDTTVLVDSCNQLYVFGSIHDVRNNANLLKRSCLDELLSNTDASISLPANQLNCGVDANSSNCLCQKPTCGKPFKTDMNKFNVNLRFQPSDDCEKPSGLCEFLKALQNCNEAPQCSNTCEPCDPSIYLNVFECGEKGGPVINSITILNKKSVCKTVSQGRPDICKFCLSPDTVVDFDLNHYCVDGDDVSLSKTIVLYTGASSRRNDCANITLYVDLDKPGSISFVPPQRSPNVEFVVDASNEHQQFILNYGDILDPVELTNLKSILIDTCGFPCPQFKNPLCNKVINTYLRGGDNVNFYFKHKCGIKLAVTADVPTVFPIKTKVLDIGVGDNNLSVLTGQANCPNKIRAIGKNCHGELGIDSFENTVVWKEVNRCLFDCPVNAIFTGPCWVTMYVTQSGRVYGTGIWKHLVNSIIPVAVNCIPKEWKTKQIAIGKDHLVILTNDSCLFGAGDNSLGQLGLCHIDCVPCPVPIDFSTDVTNKMASQLLGYRANTKICKPLYNSCDDCPPNQGGRNNGNGYNNNNNNNNHNNNKSSQRRINSRF